MPAAVTVVVPWRPDPDRRQAWDWVRAQYRDRHPDWTIIEAPAPVGEWCKAKAVNDATATVQDGVVIVADADVWAPNLADAVSAVEEGAAWAIPHRLVHRLTREATRSLLAGGIPTGTCEPPYEGIQGGGIVVLPARTAHEIPMDERFLGWGQEDQAWGVALHFLAAPAVRLNADLVHLWHPPQPRENRKIGSLAGFELHRRYLKARHDPSLLRDLVKGGRRRDP